MTIHANLRYAFALIAGSAIIASLGIVAASSQQVKPDGRAIFMANCATCHGLDGSGNRTPAEVGFTLPMPNFTDCSFATREADADWSSTIYRGGPQRAFPRIMPAFGEALTEDEIDAVIGYIRTFCKDDRWVRGEFNFPLGLFTEKAFPEDELVWSNAIDTHGPTNIELQIVFEKRFGPTGQLEVTLPMGILAGQGFGTRGGIGDVGFAWKQNLLANVDSGTIVSVLGEWVLPTGNARYGLGTGSMAFETHALFAQTLPEDFVFQGQVFASFPVRQGYSDEVGWHFNLGKTFAEEDGYGRAWTPMVELIGARELAHGAVTDWDVVPQFQVSLSTRQHVLVDFGARIPINQTSVRNTQFMFYFIWDWYDAGLFQAW